MSRTLSKLMFQSSVARKTSMTAGGLAGGLLVAAALTAGCATNLCETAPEDPHCAGTVTPGQLTLSVSPLRLSLSQGGSLTVKLGSTPPAGTRAFLRRAGAGDLLLATLDKSEQMVAVKAADLVGRTPGMAQLVVSQADQADMTVSMRLFVEPVFKDPPKEYDTKADGNSPIWAGVGENGGIYTLNTFPPFMGSPDKQLRIVDYQYGNGMLALRAPQSFGAYRGYPISDMLPGRGAIVADRVVAVSKNPVSAMYPVLTDLCSYKTQTCQQLNPMTLEFQKLLGLAADRRGNLVAVQTDAQVLAYRGSDVTPFSERLTLQGMGTNKGAVVAVAVGDLDGDGQPDLVTLHQGPIGASVFLRASDTRTLRYSDPYSAQLQGALGGVLPTAMVMADLDADGLDDVALARGSMVSLLINQGDGSFSAMSPIASITAIDGLALGSVDVGAGSRSTDLVISSSVSQKLSVLLNQAAY